MLFPIFTFVTFTPLVSLGFLTVALLHSRVPVQGSDEFLHIIFGTELSILQQPISIGHCISVKARMSKGVADFLFLVSDQPAAKKKFFWDKSTPSGIQSEFVLSTTW